MKPSTLTRLILVLTALFLTQAFAGVFLSVNVAPPPIPVYAQPACPGDGYIWTPGYWGYGDAGYYWIAGTWVNAPRPGFLWTPGYWGWGGGIYRWRAGYWGPRVGYYGGINYGFGYFGSGFVGGRWVGSAFHYNTAVSNVNVTNIHNTYIDRTVVHNNNAGAVNHSFNGPGGVTAQASHHEMAASRASNVGATPAQVAHAQAAHANHIANRGGGGGGHANAGGHRGR